MASNYFTEILQFCVNSSSLVFRNQTGIGTWLLVLVSNVQAWNSKNFGLAWVFLPAYSCSSRVANLRPHRSEIRPRRISLCHQSTLNRSRIRQTKIAGLKTIPYRGPTGKFWLTSGATLGNPVTLCSPKLRSIKRAKLLTSGCYALPIQMRPFGWKSTTQRSMTSSAGIPSRLSITADLCLFAAMSSSLSICVEMSYLMDLLETRNAGTWPPPLVTFAKPVALKRVKNPHSFPRNI